MAVNLYATHMAARRMATSTIRRRLSVLKRFEKWMAPLPITAATTADLERFLATFSSPNTVHAYASDLKGAFDFWESRKMLPGDDPAAPLGAVRVPPGKPRPFSMSEARLLLGAARTRNERRAVMLACLAGLRVAEMAGLHSSDIDFDAKLLRVTGKGGRKRDVPLHPDLERELRDERGWVLARLDGRPLSPRTVTWMGSELCKRAGIWAPGKALHAGRHWFGTHLDADLDVVQELLGHASPATTRVYRRVNQAKKAAAVDALKFSA